MDDFCFNIYYGGLPHEDHSRGFEMETCAVVIASCWGRKELQPRERSASISRHESGGYGLYTNEFLRIMYKLILILLDVSPS